MQLNTLKPADGSKKDRKRVARGIGSGLGKTAGRGHKGQKSRSGGFHKVGFEGGQMPLQRRLPKVGFRSAKSLRTAEVRLYQFASVDANEFDLAKLIELKMVPSNTLDAKVVLAGEIEKPITLKGVRATKGAQKAIEAAGGKVE